MNQPLRRLGCAFHRPALVAATASLCFPATLFGWIVREFEEHGVLEYGMTSSSRRSSRLKQWGFGVGSFDIEKSQGQEEQKSP